MNAKLRITELSRDKPFLLTRGFFRMDVAGAGSEASRGSEYPNHRAFDANP